jgi:Protein of unknown function (DUF4231)
VSAWRRRDPPDEDIIVPEEIRQHPGWVRLNSQIAAFEDSAKSNHRNYNLTRSVEIVIGAFIPIVGLADISWSKYVVASLGAVIAIMVGIRQLWGNESLWTLHDSTANSLKREQTLFLGNSGPYSFSPQEENLRLLIERSEEITARAQGQGGERWVRERSV